MNKMNPEVKTLWITALRSGEYKQGHSLLHSVADEFCCLGVLCELAVNEGILNPPVYTSGVYAYEGHTALPPEVVTEWAGLEGAHGDFTNESEDGEGTYEESLVSMNDQGKSFAEIADKIEKHF